MQLLINEFIRKNGKEKLYLEQKIITKWGDMMQNTNFKNTKATKIRGGILYISHLTAAQRFELTNIRNLLVEQLNQSVGSEVITGIVFNL